MPDNTTLANYWSLLEARHYDLAFFKIVMFSKCELTCIVS